LGPDTGLNRACVISRHNTSLRLKAYHITKRAVKGRNIPCGYYFEMSHLITNLKCHIGKLSSKNYRRIGDGKNIDYGGRVEET
jgi:hypothetical protein